MSTLKHAEYGNHVGKSDMMHGTPFLNPYADPKVPKERLSHAVMILENELAKPVDDTLNNSGKIHGFGGTVTGTS